MHHFKVYDVDSDGVRHFSGKIIDVKDLPVCNNLEEFISFGSIVQDLFSTFGFTKYIIMYRLRVATDNNFEIVYSHNVAGAITPTDTGTRVIWYLERGA